MTTQPACPECEKLLQVHEESQKLGLFLDWLFSNEGTLCKWKSETFYDGHGNETSEEEADYIEHEGYFPIHKNIEHILADYFEIDLRKVDQEREILLNWIREQQEEK